MRSLQEFSKNFKNYRNYRNYKTTEVLISPPSLLSLLVHVVSCVMASEAITVPEFVLKYGDSKVKLDRTIGRCKTAKSNLFVLGCSRFADCDCVSCLGIRLNLI